MTPERDSIDGASPPERVAFEGVYSENVAFVFRTLRQMGVPEATLEDAVQNVFLVVHRRLSEFEGRASMRTWLFRIVRRVASDARRSVKRRGVPEPMDDSLAYGGTAPDTAAERNEAARQLAQLLEALDDDKRAVFVLAELEQMSAPEIAEALGVNLNTVGSRLRAARAAFEKALERAQRRLR